MLSVRRERPGIRCVGITALALRGRWLLVLILAGLFWTDAAQGQNLRFDNRRDVAVPDYAFIRIGPFYSNAEFTQRAGYRYTRSSGAGSDYYYNNNLGRIREDGSEFPLVSTLDFRNYLVVSRHTDLDMSVRLSYRHYLLGTEENEFDVSLPDEGLSATISSIFLRTPVFMGTVQEDFVYRVNYLDTRGYEDEAAGSRNEYIDNRIGVYFDWLAAKNKNLGVDLSRRDYLTFEDAFENQERVEYRETVLYEQQVLSGVVLGGSVSFVQTDFRVEDRADTSQQDYRVFARGSSSEGGDLGLKLTEASTLSLSAGVSVGATTSEGRRQIEDENGEFIEEPIQDEEPGSLVMSARAALKTQLSKILSHEIIYERGLRSGFERAFEEYDSLQYNLFLDTESGDVRIYSRYDVVEPVGDQNNGYTAWVSGIDAKYPLFKVLSLDGGWSYTRRVSKAVNPDDPDQIADYTSQRARAGTTVELMKKLNWETYVMREVRNSENDEQSFTRDTFETTLVWRHRF